LSELNQFLEIQNVKRSISKAETVFDNHSIIFFKKMHNLGSDGLIKTENELKLDADIEEKKLLKMSENIIEPEIETLDVAQLKTLVKLMIANRNKMANQNQDLLQKIEKQVDENKKHEELNKLQNKEIKQLQQICKKLTKIYKEKPIQDEDEDKQIFIPIETENKNKLKKKTPDDSANSVISEQEVDDFCPKWPSDEEHFIQNTQDWQFQFKKSGFHIKYEIDHINVQLKNNSPGFLSIDNIYIKSSESKYLLF